MKSRTSFFNPGLFKSTLRRFWPLWALHFAGWLLFMPVLTLVNNIGHSSTDNFVYSVAHGGVSAAPIVAFFMALFTAMAVFGFMYNNRITGLIASLPVRREAVFFSSWLGGVVPVLVSNIVIALLTFLFSLSADLNTALVLKAMWVWLAVYSMDFLLFFGIASIIAVMTGSMVALPILYVIFNFLAVGMEQVVRLYLASLVWGMSNLAYSSVLDFLSPVVYLVCGEGLSVKYQYFDVVTNSGDFSTISTVAECVKVYYEAWLSVSIYCAVGIVLSAAALLVFKKRRMEAVGDVIAIALLRPVFKYGVAACCALCGGIVLYVVLYALFNDPAVSVFLMIPSMCVFAFIGYFGAKMLLNKSFHVFRGSWVGYIVLCFVCAVFTLSCDLDIFGVGRYVPDPADVDTIAVIDVGKIKSREAIEKFAALHEKLVSDEDKYRASADDEFAKSVYFEYKLKNGKVVTREYELPESSEAVKEYFALMNDPAVLLERFTPSVPVDEEHCLTAHLNADYLGVEFGLTPAQAVDYYYNALIPDIKSGNKIIDTNYDNYLGTMIIVFTNDSGAGTIDDHSELIVELSAECVHSIQWIKDNLGVDLTVNPEAETEQ